MYDLIVIGGGPAGLAAAYAAYSNGVKKILLIEREEFTGGILNQCIHNGFGLHYFKEELTGPEYASKFIKMLNETSVEVITGTMVLSITPKKEVHIVNKKMGFKILNAKAIVLAMGCRERTRGAISIPGTRPVGIYTAGSAQKYANIEGFLVGKRVLILGSGDIGLIMARRMTLEGSNVLGVVEIMSYSGGLNRNIVQCLSDYNIPLFLSHTITDIIGNKRVERVIVSKVDENKKPIKGTEIEFKCDSILLSVGLIPENELTKDANIEIDRRTKGPKVFENMETSMEGVFGCGNVVHVHDLVDYVTKESMRAGEAAARYIKDGEVKNEALITLKNGNGISYTVPQKLRVNNIDKFVEVFFRVNKVFKKSNIKVVDQDLKTLVSYKREYIMPGEMEMIVLPKGMLINNKNNVIEIIVEEEIKRGD